MAAFNMKKLRIFIALSILLSISFGLNAQLIALKKKSVLDTTELTEEIHIFDLNIINSELRKSGDNILKLNINIQGFDTRLLDSLFTKQSILLVKESEEFRSYNPYNLSKFFLNNTFLVWSNYQIQFQKWQSEIGVKLQTVIEGLHQINLSKKNWKLTLKEIKGQKNHTLESHIKGIIFDFDSLQGVYIQFEDDLLLLETRIEDKTFLCDQIISETTFLQEGLRRKTFSKTDSSIWNIQLINSFEGTFANKLSKAWSNNYTSARYYFSSIGSSVLSYIFWALLITSAVLLVRKKYLSLNISPNQEEQINIRKIIINHPYAIIVATLILLWIMIFPSIPLLLSDVLFIGIVYSLSLVLTPFVNKSGKRVLKALLFLLLLNIFELYFWYLGDYVRLYLMVETLIALFIIAHFFKVIRNNVSEIDDSKVFKIVRKTIPLLFSFYLIAFLANSFGYVNLSVLITKIAIRTVAMSIIAFGYLKIFENLSFASMAILEKSFPNFSAKHLGTIRKRTIQFVQVFMLLLWVRSMLNIFEIRQEVYELGKGFFTTELEIGSLSISLANIFLFILILILTYLLASFTKNIVEKEILQSIKLPRGVPAAISMVLRIFFVAVGVVFAISAAGIDMSNFGMIAGALGVGIGFGLQNIVQNFISGLILIFERPIQVGDTVEVDTLIGKVKDIGVRASNVITYDGAEVVVPNSNLVANNLINWTLSDSRKRIELNVGTAYGSNPNEVLEILKDVAKNHPNVVKTPAPMALFDGFGDSSLDFRLLFWVSFEFGLVTKSDVAIGIYNKFAEHNIEIPFPQIDLHVKKDTDLN